MKWIDSVRTEGAYGFPLEVKVGQSRRGHWWAEVSGFRWRGNEGRMVTRRYRLAAEDAKEIINLMAQVEAGEPTATVADVVDRVYDATAYEA
jgi:hypothetical protein